MGKLFQNIIYPKKFTKKTPNKPKRIITMNISRVLKRCLESMGLNSLDYTTSKKSTVAVF